MDSLNKKMIICFCITMNTPQNYPNVGVVICRCVGWTPVNLYWSMSTGIYAESVFQYLQNRLISGVLEQVLSHTEINVKHRITDIFPRILK